MKTHSSLFFQKGVRSVLALFTAAMLCISGCASVSGTGGKDLAAAGKDAADTSRYLRITGTEPDTADPQCTASYYNVPLNVFDRLVEVQVDDDGNSSFVPSLADSWEISDDGLVYTFHLHEGVIFSNGSPLTSSDVEYTLIRAITWPDSQAGDIGEYIVGGEELRDGKTRKLEGFRSLSDLDFTITLTYPYAAFLALLSIPQYSILDQETTEAAGDRFGKDPEVTVGTGPFVFREWNPGKEMILAANTDCWSGAPGCDGIFMHFVMDAEAKRLMFEEGELDILDLEDLGIDAEYFIRGDIYQDRLCHGRRVGLTYIALNESVKPLNDVRVRRALQLALDRSAILMNVYGGRGTLENGIYPHGLIGFNPDLPEIPYDPKEAAALLAKAGYSDGFDLEITVDDVSSYYSGEILELAASMWEKIGVRTTVRTVDENTFLELRRNSQIACYASRFSVDYNDPDSMIYLFFGTIEGTRSRSLCYGREDIIDRVFNACSIVSDEERLQEYRDLERIIAQEDCAWIPLFSNDHYFIVNERVRNFRVSWNGWSDTRYRNVVIEDPQ